MSAITPVFQITFRRSQMPSSPREHNTILGKDINPEMQRSVTLPEKAKHADVVMVCDIEPGRLHIAADVVSQAAICFLA